MDSKLNKTEAAAGGNISYQGLTTTISRTTTSTAANNNNPISIISKSPPSCSCTSGESIPTLSRRGYKQTNTTVPCLIILLPQPQPQPKPKPKSCLPPDIGINAGIGWDGVDEAQGVSYIEWIIYPDCYSYWALIYEYKSTASVAVQYLPA